MGFLNNLLFDVSMKVNDAKSDREFSRIEREAKADERKYLDKIRREGKEYVSTGKAMISKAQNTLIISVGDCNRELYRYNEVGEAHAERKRNVMTRLGRKEKVKTYTIEEIKVEFDDAPKSSEIYWDDSDPFDVQSVGMNFWSQAMRFEADVYKQIAAIEQAKAKLAVLAQIMEEEKKILETMEESILVERDEDSAKVAKRIEDMLADNIAGRKSEMDACLKDAENLLRSTKYVQWR